MRSNRKYLFFFSWSVECVLLLVPSGPLWALCVCWGDLSLHRLRHSSSTFFFISLGLENPSRMLKFSLLWHGFKEFFFRVTHNISRVRLRLSIAASSLRFDPLLSSPTCRIRDDKESLKRFLINQRVKLCIETRSKFSLIILFSSFSLSLYESSNFTINFPLSSIWIVCSAISNRAITRKTKTSSSWQSGSSNVSTWEMKSMQFQSRRSSQLFAADMILLPEFLSFWLPLKLLTQATRRFASRANNRRRREILQHDLHVSIAFHRWSECSTYPKFSTVKIQWWRTQCNQVQLCWETFHDTYKLAFHTQLKEKWAARAYLNSIRNPHNNHHMWSECFRSMAKQLDSLSKNW